MTYYDEDEALEEDDDPGHASGRRAMRDRELPDASDMDDPNDEDAPRRYPWWLIAGVVLCLIVILLFWMR